MTLFLFQIQKKTWLTNEQHRMGEQLQCPPLPSAIWWLQGIWNGPGTGVLCAGQLYTGQDGPCAYWTEAVMAIVLVFSLFSALVCLVIFAVLSE